MSHATQPAPHSPEAERAVLGGVLLLPETLGALQALGLRPEHFYGDRHALVWEALLGLAASEQPIDSVTLRDWLGAKKLERVGGDEYLGKLTDTIPTVVNITAHAKIVLEKAARRRKREALLRALAAVNEGIVEDVDEAARQVLEIRAARSVVLYEPRHLIQAAEDAARSKSRGVGGIKTGYHLLDPLIPHIDPGEVITVGARSGCGKSLLSLGVAVNVSSLGRKVGVLSTEDPAKRWGLRLAAKLHGQLTAAIMAQPQLNFDQRERVEAAKQAGDRMREFFKYAQAPNEELPVVLEHLDALLEWGAELVVLDHFHAMRLPIVKGQTQAQVVADAVLSIVHRTRRAGAALLLAAQFGRPDKHGRFDEPTMFDFRDSSQFEISSDYMLLTWKTSDQSRAPIYGKIGKLKDSDERTRFKLEFADNGALYDLVEYTPPPEPERGGGITRKSRGEA